MAVRGATAAATGPGERATTIITTPLCHSFPTAFSSMPARSSEPSPPAADEAAASSDAGILRERPSKTRRKQESHDLQSLGEALLELGDDHLDSLGLGET